MRIAIALFFLASIAGAQDAPQLTREQIRASTMASYHARFDARNQAAIAAAKKAGKDTTRAEKWCLHPWTVLDIGSCTYELQKLGANPAADRFLWSPPPKVIK